MVWRIAFLAVVLACVATPAESAEPSGLRLLRCNAKSPAELAAWQRTARTTVAVLLNIDDQIAANVHDARGRSPIPLDPEVLKTEKAEKHTRYDLKIDSGFGRRFSVVLTVPVDAKKGRTPAVICIHGHGGNRHAVYKQDSIYRGFARVLADSGYVTLSTNVGWHNARGKKRTLMGRRLWRLIRLVDLAASRPEVDRERIGCAGLSLGGEMAMWLGAMDTRVAATVSSGFLGRMETMRTGHCMCWDFPGLQRRYDWADVYSMIAPRPLQCQNGQKEPARGFPVSLAKEAMSEISQAYKAAGHEDAAELAVHPDGHVFDVTAGVRFLDATLKGR